MVRVVGSPTIQDFDHLISFVVSVRVLQPNQTWLVYYENSTVEEIKPSGAMQLVVENRRLVCFTIRIGVFQDDQLVIGTLVARTPLRISRHTSDPQSPSVVEVDLDWLCNFRKLSLLGKQLDLHSVRHFRCGDEL